MAPAVDLAFGGHLSSGSRVVVRHTFVEIVPCGTASEYSVLPRRVCSDSALYNTCAEEEHAMEQRRRAVKQQKECEQQAVEVDEFQLTGLSDTETEPELVEPMLQCYDHLWLQQTCSSESCGSGSGLVGSGCITPQSDSDSRLGNLGQLMSENARLALENQLLKENMRLAMEKNQLEKMIAESCGQESMAAESYNQTPQLDACWAGWGMLPGAGGVLYGMPAAVDSRMAQAEGRKAKKEKPSRGQAKTSEVEVGCTHQEGAGGGYCPEFVSSDATTVMLRNVPNNYSRAMVLDMLDGEGFGGLYDFLYLPMDFNSRACLGYAFVNLVSPGVVQRFWKHFDGFSNWMLPSRKVCRVGWAGPHQGLDAHVNRYLNSPVMHDTVPDEFKPVLFQDGVRIQFPGPTKLARAPRVRQREAPHHHRGNGASRR